MLKPLRSYVLLQKVKEEKKEVGIILTTHLETQYNVGVVRAVGDGIVLMDGTKVPVGVSVGDTVYYTRQPHGAVDCKVSLDDKNEDCLLIREDDIICVVNK